MSQVTPSSLTKMIIGTVFAFGLVILTGMGVIPWDAFTPLAASAVTWLVQEWAKEKEISRVMKLLGK